MCFLLAGKNLCVAKEKFSSGAVTTVPVDIIQAPVVALQIAGPHASG